MSTLPVIAAVDGSDDSLVALDWAFEAALTRDAQLSVVHVQQYPAWARPDSLPVGRPEPEDDTVLNLARRYLAGHELVRDAVNQFARDVRAAKFPAREEVLA